MLSIIVTLAVVLAVFALGGWLVDQFGSDSAHRLAVQIEHEANRLRKSGETHRTFAHYPKSWPCGIGGDYRVEFRPDHSHGARCERGIYTARSCDGPLGDSTFYHTHFVRVPANLKAVHHKGEPTLVTLEKYDGRVYVTGLN